MKNNKQKVIEGLKYLLENLNNSSNQDKLLKLSRLTIDKVSSEDDIFLVVKLKNIYLMIVKMVLEK